MARRIESVLKKLERFQGAKEKAESVKDWNDLVHDFGELVSDHGSHLDSQLSDSIHTILSYTEPPQTDLTTDIDSVKSNLEQALEVYNGTNQNNNVHNPMSKTTVILTCLTIALVAASAVTFYITQYAVSFLTIVNVNCTPLQFENANQPFKLVKLPGSPISKGGYAQAIVPAGTITLDNTAESKLRIGYSFGQSIFIDLPLNVSGLRLNNSQELYGSQLSLDVPKDGRNSLSISCLDV
jgi:hypothetical protein